MPETIVVKRSGALGNCLYTTPVIHRLRIENPDARIVVYTAFPAAYWNSVDNVEVNPPKESLPTEYKYIDLDMASETRQTMHEVDAYLEAAFGDTKGDKTLRLTEDECMVRSWARGIILHPNVSWPNRTLSKEWWGELGKKLREKGYKVLATGTSLDHDLSEYGVIDTRGKLNFAQQKYLIQRSKLLICGDSSLFALAGTTETATIGFCTITPAELMLPYRHGELGWNFTAFGASIPCYGCHSVTPPTTRLDCRYGHNKCVTTFKHSEVLDVVKVYLHG